MELTTRFYIPPGYGVGTIITSMPLHRTQAALEEIIESPAERLAREERRITEWVRPSENPVKPFDGEIDRDGFEIRCKGYQFMFERQTRDVGSAWLTGTFDPIDNGTRINLRMTWLLNIVLGFVGPFALFCVSILVAIVTRFHFVAILAVLILATIIAHQLLCYRRDFREVAEKIADHIRHAETA